ncbi:MAG: hypothetical protein D4R38_02675 [Dehalococcoidia bacterium]|nr:MAG: hypothetical protein D4R38_02675 [Dehalococcoidia bacterium]
MSDYPTDKELKKIKEWPVNDLSGIMSYIQPLWTFGDCGYWSQERNIYYLSTTGWSGNESIIEAMQENFIFWALYWCKTKRGGHYVFASMQDWLAAEHQMHLTAYGVGPLAGLGNLLTRLGRWFVRYGGK